ncbi:hypothetical protein AVEN_199570-1, partial [Araneus ventricosus]
MFVARLQEMDPFVPNFKQGKNFQHLTTRDNIIPTANI